MIYFATALLVLSFAYLVLVFVRKRMRLASNYAVYVLFSVIYTVFPILTYFGIEPKIWFTHYSLNESELLVSVQVILISLCSFIFGWVYNSRQRVRATESVTDPAKVEGGGVRLLLFLAFMLSVAFLYYFGSQYAYKTGRPEMVHSFITNGKVVLASMYAYFLIRYGLSYHIVIMFAGVLAVLLVEYSRSTFLSVLVCTMFYLQNNRKLSNRLTIVFGLLITVLLSYVAVLRARVAAAGYSLLLNPFFAEGDYGSYMILQTYDLVFRGVIKFYTFFLDYLIDPIIYLVPRAVTVFFGVNKDALGLFKYFVASHQEYLTELYAPIGGFHYIAQASSALPFIGPLVITYLFARITVGVEDRLNKSGLHELTYYLYSAGFMWFFMKTVFANTIHYYLTLAAPAYILWFVFRKRATATDQTSPAASDSSGNPT